MKKGKSGNLENSELRKSGNQENTELRKEKMELGTRKYTGDVEKSIWR